jgi:uncharacterized protein YdeI (YjbR/CyaY-like superfamily)
VATRKRSGPAPELPTLRFTSARVFSSWLAKNHDQAPGLWLEFAKKGSDVASVTYAEAVEVALCWGWIDGQAQSIDERCYRQRFTPRAVRSLWSKINRERVAKLNADGTMQPAGLAEIERAKGDGRWDRAYDSPRSATVPDDLDAALAKNEQAAAFFATLSASNRYAILHRLQIAKKPETRARRIATVIAMLSRGEKLY